MKNKQQLAISIIISIYTSTHHYPIITNTNILHTTLHLLQTSLQQTLAINLKHGLAYRCFQRIVSTIHPQEVNTNYYLVYH